MITRVFEQTWEETKNPINNNIEENVLIDFYSYLTNLNDDLQAIKTYYEQKFNSSSPIKLDTYITELNALTNAFNEICIDKTKLNTFCKNIFSMKDVNLNIYTKEGNKYKIKDEYFASLNKIANMIFALEENCSWQVKQLWENAFSNINDYDKDKKYCLLAHVDHKSIKPKDIGDDFAYYSENQKGICCSIITDEKTRLYDNTNVYDYYTSRNGLVGIIVKQKSGKIVAGSYNDMLSTEYVNNKCELKRYFKHSKVDKCFDNDKNTIYSSGTKIFTPKHAFDCSADTINEIIFDKEDIEVVAVFYTKSVYNEIPVRLKEFLAQQESIVGHKLPVIEIQQRNKIKQVDMENLY